jgi:exodeoxyribonuclease V alpha subunit
LKTSLIANSVTAPTTAPVTCEFKAVVLALSMQHFVLLRRNLLYTALTRAKRLLVVVGTQRALRTAVEMGAVEQRASLLERRLRAGTAA